MGRIRNVFICIPYTKCVNEASNEQTFYIWNVFWNDFIKKLTFCNWFFHWYCLQWLWFEYLLFIPMQIKVLIEDSNWSCVVVVYNMPNTNSSQKFEKIKISCKATSKKCFCVFSSQENLGNFICYLSCRCIRSILCVLYIINSTKCLSILVCPVLQDVPLRIYDTS